MKQLHAEIFLLYLDLQLYMELFVSIDLNLCV